MQYSTERVLALPVPDPSFAKINPRFFEAQLDDDYDYDGPSTYDGLAVIEAWAHFALNNMTDNLEPSARALRHVHAIVGVWVDAIEERLRQAMREDASWSTDSARNGRISVEAVDANFARYRREADVMEEEAVQPRRDLIEATNEGNEVGPWRPDLT